MMIHKRLIAMVDGIWRYIRKNIVFQWIGMAANIVMIFFVGYLLQQIFLETVTTQQLIVVAVVFGLAAIVRYFCSKASTRMSYESAVRVKEVLRTSIYRKLLSLGIGYGQHIKTAEAVQIAGEGVEQMEIYFGRYLPQLIYSLVAPITLFVVLLFVNVPAAAVLLACVPLIPIAIIAIQKLAKKIFRKYWGSYTDLGAGFLENMQGLTTLKIYSADEKKHREMNERAEKFRIATMKVLTMQLGSVTIMDLVAFGGSAAGILVAVFQLQAGAIDIMGCVCIILLSAEFFIPLRLLGSYFHVAMNGMAACDKMFDLLDVPTKDTKKEEMNPDNMDIRMEQVSFSYGQAEPVLKNLSVFIPQGKFISLVGESGCGKSTAAALLIGMRKGYRGNITIGGVEASEVAEESLLRHITLVSHDSYLFRGSVRQNLLIAKPDATEDEMWNVLKQVKLDQMLRAQSGLDTFLEENAANFSGGQKQRLALARALLHDAELYIFDEATSNIDTESEEFILEVIKKIAKHKGVLMISHRLENVVPSDRIYVLDQGEIKESGTHSELLAKNGAYAELYEKQQELEAFSPKEENGREKIA